MNEADDGDNDIDGGWAGTTSLVGIDPQFVRNPWPGPEGIWGTGDDDYGDLQPIATSLAINTGTNSLAVDPQGNPLSIDTAGLPRFDTHDGTVDIGAYEYQSLPPAGREMPALTVDDLSDTVDPYDGKITLREAIFYAGMDTLGNEITFDPNLFTGGEQTITLTVGQYLIDKDLAIMGPGAELLTLDANDASRVFYVGAETDVAISGLTMTGGSASNGGGIYNYGDTLTITDSAIVGNLASYNGAGIYNNTGTLNLINSTLAGNSAGNYGGGIYDDTGILNVTNSTLSANSAKFAAGIHCYYSPYYLLPHLTLNNTIVTLNEASDSDNNIYGNWSGTGNLVGIDPQFVRTPSAGLDGNWGTGDDDYGDLRLTAASLAINKGANDLAVNPQGNPLTVDAAGQPRFDTYDDVVDIGAYEYQNQLAAGRDTPSLTVTDLSDTADAYDGKITLREAIFYSGMNALGSEITFAPSLFTDGVKAITLATGQYEIRHDLSITGPDNGILILDADGASRVFYVTGRETDVTISNLTITGGSANAGGGIYNTATLTITNSTISDNSATGDLSSGGGIYNDATLIITNSTIAGNSAAGQLGSRLLQRWRWDL